LKSLGHYYSWTNSSDGDRRILSRIDHALGNNDWMANFINCSVNYMNAGVSDHSPLVVKVKEDTGGGGRPFRFLNHLASHKQFDLIVLEVVYLLNL
jgi:hypothetical protein